jgi:hypothetical protein
VCQDKIGRLGGVAGSVVLYVIITYINNLFIKKINIDIHSII